MLFFVFIQTLSLSPFSMEVMILFDFLRKALSTIFHFWFNLNFYVFIATIQQYTLQPSINCVNLEKRLKVGIECTSICIRSRVLPYELLTYFIKESLRIAEELIWIFKTYFLYFADGKILLYYITISFRI